MGTTSRHVETSTTGKALTLGELREFVAALDHAGAANTTPIKAIVRWGGGLKKLSATAQRFGDGITRPDTRMPDRIGRRGLEQ